MPANLLVGASTRLVPASLVAVLLLLCLTACQNRPNPEWQWRRAETGLPRRAITLSLAVDPDKSDRLWVGYYATGGLAMSQDRGQTWTMSDATQPGLVDNPVFDLLPSTGGHELWAASRDGLLHSPDNGATWQPVAAGLPPVTAFALAADAGGRLYVGLDQAGLYAQAGAGGWQPLTPTGPPARAAVLSLAVSADGQRLYAGTARQGLLASADGGQSWVTTYPDHYIPNIVLNPNQPEQAVASLRNRLARTLDGGESWHTLPVAWAEEGIFALLWLADGTLAAGTGKGRLYHSLDGGDSWTTTATLRNAGAILDVAVTGERIVAGTWTGLYASDDGGQSWLALAPALGTVKARALLATPNGLLLGTQAGLFGWQPDAQGWEPVSDDFPPVGVASLAMAPAPERTIYAGASVAGVYRS
ncbi:MAG: hypothetical protein AB1801_18645, partial [Chloroflexota bacterium]